MKSHGDLWMSNVPIDKANEEIKYIGFEYSEMFTCFMI